MAKVGLDVHAAQTYVAVLDPVSGEVRTRRIVGPPERALDFVASLGNGVVGVYEAGPTGFVLARAAVERGLELRVVSPGQMPRKPSDRVKTDKRDAIRLARLLAAGELSFCRVPSVAEERFRDLVRAREDLRGDLMRARHRLAKFLVRQERVYRGRAWTREHERWLARLDLDDAASRATLLDYVSAVQGLLQRRTALEQALDELAPASPYAHTIARLRCFRGIDTLSACGLAAEVGGFQRFDHPRLLSGYLGIVPCEHTSDQQRRQGGITKAGPGHARRLLVEAAHHYRHTPSVGIQLAKRQQGQDPRVCAIAWNAQRRLHHQWTKLHDRKGKPTQVVVVAQARELASFLWQADTLN
jgi:transposase